MKGRFWDEIWRQPGLIYDATELIQASSPGAHTPRTDAVETNRCIPWRARESQVTDTTPAGLMQ